MMSHVKASIVLFVRNQVSVRYAIYAIYIFRASIPKPFFFYSKIIGPKTLLLLIDFIHDTRHLCKRFRMDG